MENAEFKKLLRKYNSGECTDAEKALIESWYLQLDNTAANKLSEQEIHGIISMTVPVAPEANKTVFWKWASVAAAVLLLLASSVFFITKRENQFKTAITIPADISAPKSDRAFLTLSNGKKISLDEVIPGAVANQGNASITKTSGNGLIYHTQPHENPADKISFNTLSTPRGGQYSLTLSDGTRVWLNAASSVTYPSAFSDQERRVEVSGEVYFEVAHIANKPFRVSSKGQFIEVLGTHFNVDAYPENSSLKTTLLQGSVKVSSSGKTVLLKPGEQANLSGGMLKKAEADTEQAIAWHNGDFIFNGQRVEEIMNTISRWYDVDIEYANQIDGKQTFSGVVSRSKNLSAVIKMLKAGTSMKFEIRGRKLIVSQ